MKKAKKLISLLLALTMLSGRQFVMPISCP